jgi:hypothetical protein
MYHKLDLGFVAGWFPQGAKLVLAGVGKTQATILRKSASTLRLDHAQFLESMFYPLW